jgi:hypothetical protein
MIDFGITGIWCDTPSEFRSEFTNEFNDRTVENSSDGLFTFIFCTYHDNSAYAEVLYVLVKNEQLMFFYSTTQYELILDNKFTVTGFRVVDNNAFMFVNSLYATSDVHYLGDICDYTGNLYHTFTISSSKMISQIIETYRVGDFIEFPIHEIRKVSEDDIINCLTDFMEWKSSNFQKQIDDAKILGEPYEGIEENPFQDRFYDANITENDDK